MSHISVPHRPDFDTQFESPLWRAIARAICQTSRVDIDRLERAASSDHIVFLADDTYVLKIFRPWRNCFERERKALEFALGRMPFRTPEIVELGNFNGLDFMITTQVPGRVLTRAEFLLLPRNDQTAVFAELAVGLKQLHEVDPASFEDDWPQFIQERATTFVERQIAHGVNPMVIAALPAFIEENLKAVPSAPTCFLHGDVHFGNLRFVRENGRMRISGLFDFADSRRGFHEYEFLAVGVLMAQGERELQREFFTAYGYADADLDLAMRKRLMMLTMLYETSDLRRYALRLRPDAVDFTLDELEREIWSFV